MSDLTGYQALRAPVRPVAHQIRSMTGAFVVGPIGAVIGFVTGIVRAGPRSGHGMSIADMNVKGN